MARFVSFLVLIAILVIISIIFFQVMAGFFVPLFLAALLGVVVQPLYRWTLAKCNGYRHLAAGVTTFLVALIVLLPIGLVVSTATLEGLSLLDRLQLSNVREKLGELRHNLGLEIPQANYLRRIEAVLGTWRDKQRRGEPLDFQPAQVKDLLELVERIEQGLVASRQENLSLDEADATSLKLAIKQLLVPEAADNSLTDPEASPAADPTDTTPVPSVLREDALLQADAEFREFKRQLLGGTYRAWLTEWANPSDEQVEQLRHSVLSTVGPVLSVGGDTVILLLKIGFGTLIMIVSLFFLLAEGSRMLEALIKVSPLEEQHVRELVAEFDRACRAIVSATLLSAIAQGLLAGIGFYVAGLRGSVALLTLLTMVLALVPFTGAAAVWIPVALYLYFFQGSTGAAIGLAIYGAIVISGSDNVIKPLVLHGQSKLHPLLALLSVLGGIQALGPIGIIVGPMVVVFLQTLLHITHREMASLDRSSWMFWRGPSVAAAPAGGAATIITSAGPPNSAENYQAPPASNATNPAASGNNGKSGHQTPPKSPPQGKKKRR